MTGREAFGRAAVDIATRAELDSRVKARARPRAEMHLTIGGAEERIVHSQLNAANENRIRHLQERLDALRSGLKETQAKARLTGKAQGDFGRSRDGPG
ncbi:MULTISPECIES: hypothetical protein [Rhodomicrobium]|uniref:hypothetical protein n=1 Tax=Rhodomicrobium TaxID=1068 RepID=UPI000B4A87B7|nr:MULTISPECIES: hypothetical protein [Rhodomicrobium]